MSAGVSPAHLQHLYETAPRAIGILAWSTVDSALRAEILTYLAEQAKTNPRQRARGPLVTIYKHFRFPAPASMAARSMTTAFIAGLGYAGRADAVAALKRVEAEQPGFWMTFYAARRRARCIERFGLKATVEGRCSDE